MRWEAPAPLWVSALLPPACLPTCLPAILSTPTNTSALPICCCLNPGSNEWYVVLTQKLEIGLQSLWGVASSALSPAWWSNAKMDSAQVNGRGLDWDPGHRHRKCPTVTPRVASKGTTPVKAIPPHHSGPTRGATANPACLVTYLRT